MTILCDLFRNLFLSLVVFCLLNSIQTEPMRTSTTIRTTTTTTTKMPRRSPGLSLPMPNSYPPKCVQEVPAVLFKYEKHVEVIGNSTSSPHFNLIEVCCKGYKRYDYDWDKCVPDCGEKCLNGFCLPGGRCQCFDEFVLNDRGECVPTCPLGSPHGRCYLNGTTLCNEGYELSPSKQFCMPICEMGCGHNEVCAAPDECQCAEGYARSADPHSRMGCQPVCIPDCGYGHCVAPNQCECFSNFVKRLNRSVCETTDCYMRCENGFCANRTTCVCQNGYKYDNLTTSCLPECGDNCENGVCISPGVCRCFNGYIRNGLRCDAICENGCGYYGKCIAPNVCGCSLTDLGAFKSYQQCQFGSCNSKGRCRCREGTTRFINQCLSPDKLTTYASMRHKKLNESLVDEFNLLIGQYFQWNEERDYYNYYNNYNYKPRESSWYG